MPYHEHGTDTKDYSKEKYYAGLNRDQEAGKWYGFDELTETYPVWREQIQNARNAGVEDRIINDVLTERTAMFNWVEKPDRVNQLLGRTPEQLQKLADYKRYKHVQDYKRAFPDKSFDDIYNAIEIARPIGIDTTVLLQYPNVYKQFAEGKKLRESWLQSAWRGGLEHVATRENGDIWFSALTGTRTIEEAEAMSKMILSKIPEAPLVKTFGNEVFEESTKILTQGALSSLESSFWGLTLGGLAGTSTLALTKNPALANKAYILGHTAGQGTALAYRLFSLAAGNSFQKYQSMEDNYGKRVNIDAARAAAVLSGLVTVATEFNTFPLMMKYLGLEKLYNFGQINQNQITEALVNNDVFRQMLSELSIDYTKGISISTFNNMVESLADTLGEYITQDLTNFASTNSFIPNPTMFPQEDRMETVLANLLETFRTSVIGFAGAGLPRFLRGSRQAMKIQGAIDGYVEASNNLEQQQAEIDAIENQPNPNSTTENTEVQSATQTEQTEQTQNVDQEQSVEQTENVNEQIQTEEQTEQVSEISEEQEQPINKTSEQETINNTNETDNSVLSEYLDKVRKTDQEEAGYFHSEENQNIIQEHAKEFREKAGLSEEEADTAAQIVGTLNTFSVTHGGKPFPEMEIKTQEDIEAEQNDLSRVNKEYDINNPETWPDRERANEFVELQQQDVSTIGKNILKLFDLIRGKKRNTETAETAEENPDRVVIGVEDENLGKIRGKLKNIIRAELNAFKQNIENSNRDVADTLSTRQVDNERYEINSKMPKGKSRNPDARYTIENDIGIKTTIDFATDETDLKVRIKSQGNKTPLIFSIKNYRVANLYDVINDLFGGRTQRDMLMSETPLMQAVSEAFNKFWREQGLSLVNVVRDTISEISQPNVTRDTIPAENTNVVKEDFPFDSPTNSTARNNMPQQARLKLAQDEANWRNTVDTTLADETINARSHKQIPVMTTPLVFTLVGAKHLPVTINNGKLSLIRRDHKGMKADILKDVPRALTDPIAIAKSSEGASAEGMVVLTELTDSNGASVLAAIHLNQRGEVNKLASSYGKDKTIRNEKGEKIIVPNNEGIVKELKDGGLLYVNTEKAAQWSERTNTNLLEDVNLTGVKTETDLINLWNERKGYYYTNEYGEHTSALTWRYGKAVVEILKNSKTQSQFPTIIHDIGHINFNMMYDLARQGVTQMKEDLLTVLRHAKVTLEDFLADTKKEHGGVREKVEEYYANGLMVYMSEGVAPSKGLKGVFQRAKNFLTKIFHDIQSQLGIELSDEMREVYAHMFTITENDEDTNIYDAVTTNNALEDIIKANEKKIKGIEANRAEYMEMRQEIEENNGEFPVNEEAENRIEIYLMDKDEVDTKRDILQQQQERTRSILNIIRSLGGIKSEHIVNAFGAELAKDIQQKWRSIYRKNGLDADIIAQQLQAAGFTEFTDTNALMDWLENTPNNLKEKINDTVNPYVSINTDTLNALLELAGREGTIEYLNERLKYLQKDTETDTQAEQKEIKSWLKRLTGLSPEVDDKFKPVKRKKITQKDVNHAIKTAYQLGTDTQKTVQDTMINALKEARKADKVNYKNRLFHIKNQLKENANIQKARVEERYEKAKEKLIKQNNKLKDTLRARKEKFDINKIVNNILKMSKDNKIRVFQTREIRELLSHFDLNKSNKAKHRRKLIRNALDFETVSPFDAEGNIIENFDEIGITEEDVQDFLEKVNIDEMTVFDLKTLHEEVKRIHQEGKEAYQQWNEENKKRVANYAEGMEQGLEQYELGEDRVARSHEDFKKKFKLGNLGEGIQGFWNAVQMPGKFLEGIHNTFREYLQDIPMRLRGNMQRNVSKRISNMLHIIKNAGTSIANILYNTAITVDGQSYTNEEAIAIYALMQNEKGAKAVLWGNFMKNNTDPRAFYMSEAEAMNAINQICDYVKNNESLKAIGDAIIKDFDDNYERLSETSINVFNREINKEANYTPLHRHKTQSSTSGLQITQLVEQNPHDLLETMAMEFLISRYNISEQSQAPVNLHILGNWAVDVYKQEMFINLGQYANDMRQALLYKGTDEGLSIKEQIDAKLGTPYWNTLREIFNRTTTNRNIQLDDDTGKVAKFFMKNRAIAYNAFNPASALVQTSSFFLGMGSEYISVGNLFSSLAHVIQNIEHGEDGWHNRYLERIYEMAPEVIGNTGGDPLTNEFRNFTEFNASRETNAASRGIKTTQRFLVEYGMAGYRFFDRWTKAIIFDAAYNTMIEKGNTEANAIKYALRAVVDTQPASFSYLQPTIFAGSAWKQIIFTQFMNGLSPVFNMSVVDVCRNLSTRQWNGVKRAAISLIASALSIWAAQGIRDAFNGNWPTGEELPNGEQDDWFKWLADTWIDNMLNNVPIFNSLASAVRIARGQTTWRGRNPVGEPFELIASGLKKYFSEENDEGENTWDAIDDIAHGASELGIPLPFPYSGSKQILRLGKFLWLQFAE